MLGVVEQQPFADGFTGAECHEANRSAIHLLFDGDGAAHDEREERAWCAFLEENLVASRSELRSRGARAGGMRNR